MNDENSKGSKAIINYTLLLAFVFALTFLIIGYRYQYIPLNQKGHSLVMKIDRISGDHCYIFPAIELTGKTENEIIPGVLCK